MQTQTQTKSASINANLMELPMMKHFPNLNISNKLNTFRKGEKGLFSFLKLILFGGAAIAFCVFALPPIFILVGQVIGAILGGVAILTTIIMSPAIIRGIRSLTRSLHKTFIKNDPFRQLEVEKQKMLDNQTAFRLSKGTIVKLRDDMEIEAEKAEKDATSGQTDIIRLEGKGAKVKEAMDAMIKKGGVAAKGEDEYVNYASELQKILADAQRITNKLNQSKDFVQKYGSRHSIMKKMNQKLMMVETAMEIKISDFDATVEMLRKDFQFGQKTNQATTAAKSAMLFSKGWEFDYAMEVVTSTIAADIAITSGNLRDIDAMTSQFSLDSDELYDNLNKLADKIKVGGDIIPTAKQYANPDYKLTQSDKVKAGGFGEYF